MTAGIPRARLPRVGVGVGGGEWGCGGRDGEQC